MFGPYLLRGLVDLVLASVRSLPVAAVTLAGYGLGTSTGAVTFNSLLQSHVTDRTRGRVFALMDLLWQTGRLLGRRPAAHKPIRSGAGNAPARAHR